MPGAISWTLVPLAAYAARDHMQQAFER